MRIWKWIGLAGIVGVAAAGIVAGTATVKHRREFIEAHPDELRSRLHARHREAQARRAS